MKFSKSAIGEVSLLFGAFIQAFKVIAFKTYRACWTLSYKGQKRASDKENNCNR